jgi:phosphatidylglycerol:prolipoprotein diacylglycerol transferase
LHPILIDFGPLRLPTYGVLLVTALATALYCIVRLGRREGLDSGRLLDFSTWLIVVGMLGAKALMVLTDWRYFWQFPGELLSWATLRAGGVFYGGLIAAALFALWYTRIHRLPVGKVFDVYAPAVALGLGIGRLGCFAAGCDYGRPTASFLGVVFTHPLSHEVAGTPLGVPLHPTQIYESLATFVIFGILVWRYRHKTYDGQIFLLYLVLYAVARFFIEFLRGDEDRGFVFHHLLSTSQFIALLALGTAAVLAFYFRGRSRKAGLAASRVSEAKRARN